MELLELRTSLAGADIDILFILTRPGSDDLKVKQQQQQYSNAVFEFKHGRSRSLLRDSCQDSYVIK